MKNFSLVLLVVFVVSFAFSLFCVPVEAADSWIRPSSFYDGGWISEALAYDTSTSSYAYYDPGFPSWSEALVLYFSSNISAWKVRVWVNDGYDDYLDCWGYDGSSWVQIVNDGVLTQDAYCEFTFPEDVFSAVRVSIYTGDYGLCRLNDIALYGEVYIPGPVPEVLVLEPESAWNYIGVNHTFTARLYGDDDEPYGGGAVSWNISGVGSMLSSESTTDENGEAVAVIGSNVTGNSTVYCSADGYLLVYDCSVKEWLAESEGLSGELAVWFLVVIGGGLFAMFYTKDIIIGLACVLGCVCGVIYCEDFLTWPDLWVVIVRVVFIILATVCVLFLVREGRFAGE